ncbi:uncharacterized protein LOC103718365 isoform X2 [Phoenix dactylifera]|uniref:Uncharacterized protein LOC103718365 isoform X2 n=1 Tax=Phoenix dactylifera TaxID=42345 RepID=A0A8B7CSC8_PHODC|nr:uncharacterized protein LOC103718365 isoform X2 [Phoenix dactylifera]
MAKFTAQGNLRLLFKGDSAAFWCELRDSVRFRVGGGLERPLGIHRWSRGVKSLRPGRVWSLGNKKSSSFKAEKCLNGGDDDDDEEEEEEGEEFVRDELSYFRGLVLDISYRPINVVCWKRAICLEFMEKGSFYIPAVLRVPNLLQVVKRRRIKHNLSRKSIFYRDSYSCQYCSSRANLTIDHVLPISRGGEWKWENLVTACARCNSRKGQKTLEEANMKLIKIPKVPKDYDILTIPLTSGVAKMLKMRKGVPEEWLQYLSKPSP